MTRGGPGAAPRALHTRPSVAAPPLAPAAAPLPLTGRALIQGRLDPLCQILGLGQDGLQLLEIGRQLLRELHLGVLSLGRSAGLGAAALPRAAVLHALQGQPEHLGGGDGLRAGELAWTGPLTPTSPLTRGSPLAGLTLTHLLQNQLEELGHSHLRAAIRSGPTASARGTALPRAAALARGSALSGGSTLGRGTALSILLALLGQALDLCQQGITALGAVLLAALLTAA